LAGAVNASWAGVRSIFDSLTMLVFLLLVGRWIQRRQQRWTNDALEWLFSLTPATARRIAAAGIAEVPIEAIGPDDMVEIRAGDSIPTDGCVEQGSSSVDQSLLTGESRLAPVVPGDRCMRHGERRRAAGGARRSRRRPYTGRPAAAAGRRMQPPASAAGPVRRSRRRLVCDRGPGPGRDHVRVWLWRDVSRATDNAVAVLIVTCPCALGLATPLAVTVALGRAASDGS